MLDEETLGLLLEAISRIDTYVRKETAGGTLYRPSIPHHSIDYRPISRMKARGDNRH